MDICIISKLANEAGVSVYVARDYVLRGLLRPARRMLGLERELSRKPAGLRMQFLVTAGPAIFVFAGGSIPGAETTLKRLIIRLGLLVLGIFQLSPH